MVIVTHKPSYDTVHRVGQRVLNDGDRVDSLSDQVISLRTLSKRFSLFGENLMSWSSWKMNSIQLRSSSHLIVTSWTHRFKLWAKQWTYSQWLASFSIRAWKPFRTLLMWLLHRKLGQCSWQLVRSTSTAYPWSYWTLSGPWCRVAGSSLVLLLGSCSLGPPKGWQCTSAHCERSQ